MGTFFLAPDYSTKIQQVYLVRDSLPTIRTVVTDDDECITEELYRTMASFFEIAKPN